MKKKSTFPANGNNPLKVYRALIYERDTPKKRIRKRHMKRAILFAPLTVVFLAACSISFQSCRKSVKDSLLPGEPAAIVVPSGTVGLPEGSNGTLQVITVAGSGVAGSVDGTGIAAQFNRPSGVAMDAVGNMYVADMSSNKIRKITSAGVVSTLAGSGAASYQEGTGTAASFNTPNSVATDEAGNIYVADKNNHLIRKITPAGVVSTLAGGAGMPGNAEGPGPSARFNFPAGVAITASGNILVADSGNHKIRTITPDGFVSTFAGNGTRGTANGPSIFAQFNGPVGVTADASGNVFVADAGNHKIRKISGGVVSTLAGGGAADASGFLDGTGTNARFNNPTGVVADGASNVYVADKFNNAIRKINTTGVVTTVSGNGTAGFVDGVISVARFNSPAGIAMDAAGNLFIADGANNRIREIGFIVLVGTLAGSGIQGVVDGPSNTAQFYYPNGITIDAMGNTYVTDVYSELRKISPTGQVTTPAGSSQGGYADGTGIFAKFSFPEGLAADAAGNIYVADSWNNRIRKVTPAGVVTTFAGSGSVGTWGNAGGGYLDGPASQAKFVRPTGIAIDAAGNIYVGDAGNGRLRKITPAGIVSTLAGNGTFGFADGPAGIAQFGGLNRLAVDASGNIYVSDTYTGRIRKVTPDGTVSTLAGSGSYGFRDGPVATALFSGLGGIAVDGSGNIYVADNSNRRIRKISPAGIVSTVAGSGTAGFNDGAGSFAQFNGPTDLVISPSGALYVTDYYNNRIRKIQ